MKQDVSVWPSSNRGFRPGAPEFRGWRASSPPWLEYPSWIANRPQPVQDARRDGVGEYQPYVRRETVTGNAVNPDADKNPDPGRGADDKIRIRKEQGLSLVTPPCSFSHLGQLNEREVRNGRYRFVLADRPRGAAALIATGSEGLAGASSLAEMKVDTC